MFGSDCPLPVAAPITVPPTGDMPRGRLDARVLAGLLDEIDYGVMLVDADATVRFANSVALQECFRSRTLRLEDGHVHPRDPRQVMAFNAAVAASLLGRRGLLGLDCEDGVLSVAVLPFNESHHGITGSLLLMGKRQTCEPLTLHFFARSNGLTQAEQTVLSGLGRGLRPLQIADECGVAISTVRTQINSIRAKTATASISDLMRQVTTLPPIAPALDRLSWAPVSLRQGPPY